MDNAIDKIKRLLRLGQSDNPHEAALAMQRAYELAAKHHVDINTVNLADDEPKRKIMHDKHRVGSRLMRHRKKALAICKKYFFVYVIIDYPEVVFIGQPHDIEVAKYVFEFLSLESIRLFKRTYGQTYKRVAKSTRDNFIDGFFWGVAEVLNIASANQQALICISRKIDQYTSAIYPHTKKVGGVTNPRFNRQAVNAGYRAGKSCSLRHAITQTNTEHNQLNA